MNPRALPTPPPNTLTTQAAISHYLRARSFYQTLGAADGVHRGILSREATMAQARLAAKSNGTLLLGKEVTVAAAKMASAFFSAESGPSSKLFQKAASVVLGTQAEGKARLQCAATKPR